MDLKTLDLLPDQTRIDSEKIQQTIKEIPTLELAKLLNVAESTAKNYKRGVHRITLEQLRKLKIEPELRIGLEASNKYLELPERIPITKDLLWLIGFWKGDSDDSDTRIGVCNIEDKIIKKSYEILSGIVRKNNVSFEAETPENFKGRLLTEKSRIKKQRKQVCYTVRVYRKLFRLFFLNLVNKIENQIDVLPKELKMAFVSGFIDAEGSVNKKRKAIVIYQKDKKILILVKKLLDDSGIKSGQIVKDHDDFHLEILKGKNNENLMKFSKNSYLQSSRKKEKIYVLLFPH